MASNAVFDLVGAPEGTWLFAAMDDLQDVLYTQPGIYENLGYPSVVQIGSEWLPVREVTLFDRNIAGPVTLTENVAAGQTILAVNDTSRIYANLDLGFIDALSFPGDAEVVEVIEVIDATHIRVVRTVHNAYTAPQSLAFAQPTAQWGVDRGFATDTTTTAHAAWTPVNRLYRPADFLSLHQATRTVPLQVQTRANSTSVFLPWWTQEIPVVEETSVVLHRTRGTATVMVAAGAQLGLTVSMLTPVAASNVQLRVRRVADNGGAVQAAAVNEVVWYATGFFDPGAPDQTGDVLLPTFTSSDPATANFAMNTEMTAIRLLTAGYYSVDFEVHP